MPHKPLRTIRSSVSGSAAVSSGASSPIQSFSKGISASSATRVNALFPSRLLSVKKMIPPECAVDSNSATTSASGRLRNRGPWVKGTVQ